jgi:hypothetical protein
MKTMMTSEDDRREREREKTRNESFSPFELRWPAGAVHQKWRSIAIAAGSPRREGGDGDDSDDANIHACMHVVPPWYISTDAVCMHAARACACACMCGVRLCTVHAYVMHACVHVGRHACMYVWMVAEHKVTMDFVWGCGLMCA